MDLVDNYSFSVIHCFWIRAASSELIGSVCCPLCAKYILDFVLLVLLFCIREIISSSVIPLQTFESKILFNFNFKP